jgi:hypothetical protein
MSTTRKNITAMASETARHPQRGRRYGIDELVELAEAGDAWAICKVDEWNRHFSDEYAGDLSEICPEEGCEHFGEAVNILYAEDGSVLEVDHGTWAHYPALAKAS